MTRAAQIAALMAAVVGVASEHASEMREDVVAAPNMERPAGGGTPTGLTASARSHETGVG